MTRAEWAEVVAKWRASGLTSREFAAQAGVNANSLSHWAWQLNRAAKGKSGGQRERKGRKASPLPVVEVSATLGESRFEVELGNGRRVLVPRGFDPVELSQLVSALETGQ